MKSYTHFTIEEREKLAILYKEGKSIRYIARELGRSASSVSREIKRNKNNNDSYHPWRATVLYIIRRKNSVRPVRLKAEPKLYEWVCKGFDQYWSPEIIAERWKKEEPGNKLSHSTIYRALKKKVLPKYSPKTHLRRHGKKKNNHNSMTIKPENFIRDWPEEIIKRERLGDWEGDTVYGGIGKGLIVTCVDRKSRYLAAALLHDRSAAKTNAAIIEALKGQTVNSLSLDNGSEFAEFKALEKSLNTTIYFADPHSPWQRPSNENMNNLIRFFFPKGTNFHKVTQEMLDYVVNLINNRPRKCLGWLSPIEFLSKCCT